MAGLNLRKAQQIIKGALAKGREAAMKPLAVIVLDAGGNPMAFAREDGASPGRYAIAEGKAYGAVMLGMGCRAQMARAEAQSYFINAVNGALDGRMVPVPGGVLIRDNKGTIVGAVGVTGDTSENDEIAAMAGIELAKMSGEP